MTVVANDSGQLLDRAAAVLQDTQALLNSALSNLRSRCLEDGRVSNAKLDQHQLVSYELALCSSESAAAAFALDYAREVLAASAEEQQSPGYEVRLCTLFCAEAISSISARLRARPADFELDDAQLASAFGDASARATRMK